MIGVKCSDNVVGHTGCVCLLYHVDGFGPVNIFRSMGWFLTTLIGFDQRNGFRPCCWSNWPFLSILTMLMIFDHVNGFGPVFFLSVGSDHVVGQTGGFCQFLPC